MEVDERAIYELRLLAVRDDELAGRAERFDELDGEVAAIRARAEELDSFFAVYPDEESRLRDELATAAGELERLRTELNANQALLASAAGDEEARLAERAVARSTDRVGLAEARRERALTARDDLERLAETLPDELPELERRAVAIQPEIGDDLAEPNGLRELVDWTSHAHSELFVAARQIDAQRDRVIREANELASMLAGEPTYGSTVAQALQRAERR